MASSPSPVVRRRAYADTTPGTSWPRLGTGLLRESELNLTRAREEERSRKRAFCPRPGPDPMNLLAAVGIRSTPLLDACATGTLPSRPSTHPLFPMEPEIRDRSALLTVLTTEHFTLQGARSGTITESLGRSTIYLGSLSASLVALALILQGGSAVDDFRLFALVILPALVFLGTVTFVRVLETGIEDAIYAQAINRIRHYYLELAGDDARYFALGGHDDMRGGLANMGLSPSPWRPFFSISSVIALINSMVAGVLLGIALDGFAPRATALIAGGVLAVTALTIHYRVGYGRFLRAMEGFTPQFPSPP